MKTGNIGIIDKEFFNTRLDNEKWVYLMTIVDVTAYWQKINPNKNLTRTFYEVHYRLLEPSEPFVCTAIYLNGVVIPDTLVSPGSDHKISQDNIKRAKYHKVLLTIDDKADVRYLHERCLPFFTWYDKDYT